MAKDDDKDIIEQPHDGLFKRIFRDPANAAAHFRAYLPETLSALLLLEDAELIDGSYIEENLRSARSDLLYRVPPAQGDESDVFIYVLFEHQRKSDALMAFRLLEYMVKIWGRWLDDHEDAKQLPPIVPMVLYNGKARWSAALKMQALFNASDGLLDAVGDFNPAFSYRLVDLGPLRNEELAGTEAGWLALYVMKHVDDADPSAVIASVRERISWLSATLGLSGIRPFVYYSWSTSGREHREAVIDAYREALGPAQEEQMTTIAQDLIEEGHEKGLREGLEQGLEQGKEKARGHFANTVLQLLETRFGAMSDDRRQRVLAACIEDLEAWSSRLLQAESIEQVFGE